ncbi:methyltransferase domain-containing protein [Archaeoglobus veneficus]|uniref:tRNA (guanine(10)-N(2))-dimethyltransferase n=1 Tax=Archaeoglobus veneficus (strain DSM 11195 / SNP6) TaxID=693661 RepID=F2KMW0_ARCVS|nr:methyltransferase domain-containing protein [Archaeoglobus veneficus]AEA46134.1 RNA methylase [Archaeoglobus veneficus SNP6]
MKYAFLLSGDLPEIAFGEIRYLFGPAELDIRVAVAEAIDSLFPRLALSHEVIELITVCEWHELEEVFANMSLPPQPLCVRVKKVKPVSIKSHELERKLGAVLWRRGAKISVSSPRSIVKVYLAEKAYVGLLCHVTDTKQFEERHPNRRPYFRPGVILPRLSRALVNIAIGSGLLLDPMCGTGGFLMEAGLMNLDYIGVEAFEEIARGCALNLRHYGLHASVLCGDARKLPLKDESVDGITTDFPYLQSSKSYGTLEDLYRNSLPEFSRVLKKGCRAVLVSNLDVEDMISEHFKILDIFRYRVHGSLTRRIYVCKKC